MSIRFPQSSNTCALWAIDTTTKIVCESDGVLSPMIKGHEKLNLPTFAFHIYNRKLNKRVMFDLGSRKDWWRLPPDIVHAITTKGTFGLEVKEDVYDILRDKGIPSDKIDAVIWSHYHWDHVGKLSIFPHSTDLVVGPGFESLLPGYPSNLSSPILQEDIEGRSLHIVNFSHKGSLEKIGAFDAYDFFGDQSFYLVSTPGHTAGHISGLVRTTPQTFVFLGGDICHFPGMFRPTCQIPIPSSINVPTNDPLAGDSKCPWSIFDTCSSYPEGRLSRNNPLYSISKKPGHWHFDPAEAQRTLEGLKQLDADPNVFIAIAHDPALEMVGEFPTPLNDWKQRNLKELVHWQFLSELPTNGVPARDPLVTGIRKTKLSSV